MTKPVSSSYSINVVGRKKRKQKRGGEVEKVGGLSNESNKKTQPGRNSEERKEGRKEQMTEEEDCLIASNLRIEGTQSQSECLERTHWILQIHRELIFSHSSKLFRKEKEEEYDE